MRCKKCDAELADGQKFCIKCGAKVDEQDVNMESTIVENKSTVDEAVHSVQEKPTPQIAMEAKNQVKTDDNGSVKSKSKSKGFLKYVIGLAAIILVVLIGSCIIKGFGKAKTDICEWYSYGPADGGCVYINSQSDNKIILDDQVYSQEQGYYGNKLMVLTYGKDLYVIDKNGKDRIASDVIVAAISKEENKILYIKNYTEQNNFYFGDLYAYDIKSKKSKEIDNEVYTSEYINCLCMSPNGESFTYIKDLDQSSIQFDVYMSKNNKSGKKIGKNCFYLGIANNGKIAYYGKMDDEMVYATNNDEKMKISSDIDKIIFNKDATQAIVSSNGDSYFISQGKTKEKVSECIDSIVDLNQIYGNNGMFSSSYYNEKDIFNHLFLTESSKYVTVNTKYEVVEHENLDGISNLYYFYAKDANKIYYIENGSIYAVNCNDSKKVEALVEDEDVTDFYITDNGKYIYYRNDIDELYYIKGDKSVKVSDDVSYTVALNEDGTIYFIDNFANYVGQLYCSNKGSKRSKVDNGEVAFNIISLGDSTYFITNYNSDENVAELYKITKNNKSEKITDDLFIN